MKSEIKRRTIPVSLPKGIVSDMDKLVTKREFGSRSEIIRYGVRLVLLHEKERLHRRAEEYAYEEIKKGLTRGKRGKHAK